MSRYARRADANQSEIVAALRAAGATVQHLHTVGAGCPDILVGYQGRNYLIEIKTEDGTLTDAQVEFIGEWRGHVDVATTPEQALGAIGIGIHGR